MGTVAVSVRRWRTAAVAGLLCSALLAGCSDDDPDPIVADPPASPSASSSSASASAAPEPWQVRSKAGAVAFVEHWVEVFNEAGRTGDTAALRAISGPACKACLGYADQLDELYANGGRFESNGWTVTAIGASDRLPLSQMSVGMRIERAPEAVIRANGKRKQFPGGFANYSAEPRWRAGGWSLASLVNVS